MVDFCHIILHMLFSLRKSYVIVMGACTKSLRSIIYNVSIVDTHGKKSPSGCWDPFLCFTRSYFGVLEDKLYMPKDMCVL
jgi:hypothetical protein